jgi:hypothetical protein
MFGASQRGSYKNMTFVTRSRVSYLIALAAGAAIGVAAIGSATAAPAAPAAPAAKSAPQTVTHHYSLGASAFAPDRFGNISVDYVNNWDPTELSAVGGRCFNTGLSLPDGATLKSVTFYYTSGSASMNMEINRQNLTVHSFARLALAEIPAQSGATKYLWKTFKIKPAQAKVDMSRFAYQAGVCPHGTSTFSGLIITYTQPAS